MSLSWIYHNTHDLKCREPFGAVPSGEKVTLRLGLQATTKIETVLLRLWRNQDRVQDAELHLEKGEGNKKYYQVEIPTPVVGLYWYYFVVITGGKVYYYGNNNERLGGEGLLREQVPPPFQITVYRDFTVPDWFSRSVMYQIFVDRFYNGNENGVVNNPKKGSLLHGCWDDTPIYIKEPETGAILRWDFFGGNLEGIIKKLPYLKELGVGVLYFNPIFESPSNHKYDTADYKKIDSMFGSNEDFRRLCQKAREYNIRIILDGVFSHTGSDSIYFNKEGNYPGLGAYQSPSSPYFSWYRFNRYPDEYESWWGFGNLPNVDELNPSYLKFILEDEDSVVRYWIKMGAAGWRLDVADELPDEFIKKMRAVMKETDPESILLGEVWEDASNKVSYGEQREYLWGEELDSVMNYPFRNILLGFLLGHLDAWQVHRRLMNLAENYPKVSFYSVMNLLGSHDVPRVLTILGEAPPEQHVHPKDKAKFRLSPRQRRLGIRRLKLAVLFQMCFPGVPAIYYGDEAGMEGYTDPYNRGPYPWGREDQDLVNHYKKLIGFRNNFSALHQGEWKTAYAQGDVYGFFRKDGKEQFLILLNRSKDTEHTVTVPLSEDSRGGWREIFPQGTKLLEQQEKRGGNEALTVKLPPLEGKILARVRP